MLFIFGAFFYKIDDVSLARPENPDMAGTVQVRIEAASEDVFDDDQLRNAVYEPLEEADLINGK